MPELPEVETIRRGLARCLEGRVLARVEQRRPDLRVALPERFAERLTGRRVEAVRRRAKYLLIVLDDGTTLIIHLGMSGRMVVATGRRLEPPGRHDHVILETDDGAVVRFNDPRRFGLMALAAAGEIDRHPLIVGIGPEPLGEQFDEAALSARLAGRLTSIKAALLDQGVVAGLGNIYVSEALFHAGISPKRTAASVAGVRAGRLVPAIRRVLNDAIAAGGSTLRDYVQSTGELGRFQHRFAVYDRAGQACPGCTCEVGRTGGVRRIVQSGRSTFYCPRRQR